MHRGPTDITEEMLLRQLRLIDLHAPVILDDDPPVLGTREGELQAAAFDPSGRLVAFDLRDDRVHVVPTDIATVIESARRATARNFTAKEWIDVFGSEPYRRTFEERNCRRTGVGDRVMRSP